MNPFTLCHRASDLGDLRREFKSKCYVNMPVDCVGIRDASLTTKLRVQNALSAYRLTYNYPNGAGFPVGFPVGNATVPEQFRNRVSAEVPLLAKQGTCQCDPALVFSPYGLQAPAGGNVVQ